MKYDTVKLCHFKLLSAQAIRERSALQINSRRDFEPDSTPSQGGLFDLRLGALDYRFSCQTCEHLRVGSNSTDTSTYGPNECRISHSGHIELAAPVYHANFQKQVLKALTCLCAFCSRPCLLDTDPLAIEIIKTAPVHERLNAFYKLLKKSSKTQRTCCPHCQAPRALYHKDGLGIGRTWITCAKTAPTHTQNTPNQVQQAFQRLPFTPASAKRILARVSVNDFAFLGVSQRLEDAILDCIYVTGIFVRPVGNDLSLKYAKLRDTNEHLNNLFEAAKETKKSTALAERIVDPEKAFAKVAKCKLQSVIAVSLVWFAVLPAIAKLRTRDRLIVLKKPRKLRNITGLFLALLFCLAPQFKLINGRQSKPKTKQKPKAKAKPRTTTRKTGKSKAVKKAALDSDDLDPEITIDPDALHATIDKLQLEVNTLLNNEVRSAAQKPDVGLSGQRLITLAQRLKGKWGRFRKDLSGKRTDFSGRFNIIPDGELDLDEIGVPECAALVLTRTETVTAFNMSRLLKRVHRGYGRVDGAKSVWLSMNSKLIALNLLARPDLLTLRPGDKVERYLQNGDLVLANRQPSLHKQSIMAHRAKIVTGQALRLNLACTTPYNADFDGDEMNLHLCQTEEAQAEAREIMAVDKNVINAQNGMPLFGLKQDALVGWYLLTQADVFLERHQMMNLVMSMTYRENVGGVGGTLTATGSETHFDQMRYDLPVPAILKPTELWTGKQLMSLHLPVTLCYEKRVRTEDVNAVGVLDINERYVHIVAGELLCGALCKETLGIKKRSIIHVLANLYDGQTAVRFISDIQRVANDYLWDRGFSVGLVDCCVSSEDTTAAISVEAHKLVRNDIEGRLRKLAEVDKVVTEHAAATALTTALPNQKAQKRRVTYATYRQLEGDIAKHTGSVFSQMPVILERFISPKNPAVAMILSGSKGTPTNFVQLLALVGQQCINGVRIHSPVLTDAAYELDLQRHSILPCFGPNVSYGNACARGFIQHSYVTGLSPSELFFHAMGSREGLVNTAVKASDIGYSYRKLVKANESLTVAADRTVRACGATNAAIVQFSYGGDDLDGAHTELVNLQFMTMSNANIGTIVKKTCSRCSTKPAQSTSTQPLQQASKSAIESDAKYCKYCNDCVRALIDLRDTLVKSRSNVMTGQQKSENITITDLQLAKTPKATATTATNTTAIIGVDVTRQLDLWRTLVAASNEDIARHCFETNQSCLLTSAEYKQLKDSLFAQVFESGQFDTATRFAIVDAYAKSLRKQFGNSQTAALRGAMYWHAVIGPMSPLNIEGPEALSEVMVLVSGLERICQKYLGAHVQPGEMVGALAAQSIGEPVSQMTFNTFHFGGVSSKNVTLGFPRFNEILQCYKKIATPCTSIVLKPGCPENLARVVASLPVVYFHQLLADRGKIVPNVDAPNWLPNASASALVYTLNPKALEKHALTLDDVVAVLQDQILDTKHVYIRKVDVGSFSNIEIRLLHIDNLLELTDLERKAQRSAALVHSLRLVQSFLAQNVIVQGIPGITSVSLRRVAPAPSLSLPLPAQAQAPSPYNEIDTKNLSVTSAMSIIADTRGTSSQLALIWLMDSVMWNQTLSNDIHEVYTLLGIEAAEYVIFHELKNVFAGFGDGNIDDRHLLLQLDIMCCQGYLMPFNRHGYKFVGQPVFQQATFEKQPDVLYEGAINGITDHVQNISTSVLLGQTDTLRSGTGIISALSTSKPPYRLQSPEPTSQTPQPVNSIVFTSPTFEITEYCSTDLPDLWKPLEHVAIPAKFKRQSVPRTLSQPPQPTPIARAVPSVQPVHAAPPQANSNAVNDYRPPSPIGGSWADMSSNIPETKAKVQSPRQRTLSLADFYAHAPTPVPPPVSYRPPSPLAFTGESLNDIMNALSATNAVNALSATNATNATNANYVSDLLTALNRV